MPTLKKISNSATLLLGVLLTLGVVNMAVAQSPPNPPADALASRTDVETARRDLDQMRAQMRDLSKKMADLSTKLGDVGPNAYAYRYLGNPDRGMIGVVLAKDDHGTHVTAVTPGGPADKAGVKNGDVIAAVRGEDLQGKAKDPEKFLNEALRNLRAGQEVKLSLLRDGKPSEVTVKAERREPYNTSYAFGSNVDVDVSGAVEIRAQADRAVQQGQLDREQIERIRQQAREASRQAVEQSHAAIEEARHTMRNSELAMPWWGLNLASLNPDLGGYFGAEHGVLVLSTDQATAKSLKSGDVLLSIGGRKIERPEDALRLLREQSVGGDVKVEVLRQHKTQTLSLQAPEFKSIFVPMPPPPPAPAPPIPAPNAPAPPAPPAPAAPLAPPPPPPPAPAQPAMANNG
jgi:PDZ domain-containing secreted protein